jgi:DNA-directed RNA polymerase specialized sigma24 family protein
VDRLYRRARSALLSVPDLDDQAIWGRFVSLVHEDRRMDRKRFGGIGPIKLAKAADPSSTDFVSDLARRDQLRAFRECLDDWMRDAFDFRYAALEPKSSKEMAKALGIKVNTFDQRWNRGLAAAREEYRRRHGDWMP